MTTHERQFEQNLVLLNADVARLDGRAGHAATWNELKVAENAVEHIRGKIHTINTDAIVNNIDLMKYHVLIVDIASRLGNIEGQLIKLRQTLEESVWYKAFRLVRDAASLVGTMLKRGLQMLGNSPVGKYLPSREDIQKMLPPPRKG